MKAMIISSHSPDRDQVRRAIADALREIGVEPILLEEGVAPGEAWRTWVEDAVEEADLIIADFTQANHDVMYEIGLAQGRGKTILPIVQDGETDVAFVLDGYLYIIYDPDNLEQLRSHIRASVRRRVRMTEGVPSVA